MTGKYMKTKKKGFSAMLSGSTIERIKSRAVSDRVSQASVIETAIESYCVNNRTNSGDSETTSSDSETTSTITFLKSEILFKNKEIESLHHLLVMQGKQNLTIEHQQPDNNKVDAQPKKSKSKKSKSKKWKKKKNK